MNYTFHKGEIALQQKYNVPPNPRLVERILKDSIVNTAVPFIENQMTIIVSTCDENGHLWTSMLIGELGFVSVENEKLLQIDTSKLLSTLDDILFNNVTSKSRIGLLFMDMERRIRFRLNGSASLHKERLSIHVEEAYPNCPKYIQKRTHTPTNNTFVKSETRKGSVLEDSHLEWIKNADTFFLGSMNNTENMDASHRGGPTGFIELIEGNVLKVPDYVGNNLFNTLGNFLVCPKAGLTFMDYEKGNSLQLSGVAELLFDQEKEEDMEKTTGTGRYWLFKPEKWIETIHHNTIIWKLIDFSPFNP